MNSPKNHASPLLASTRPFRRRRLLFLTVISFGLFLLFRGSIDLPSALKDVGVPNLSRANIAHLVKSESQLLKPKAVDEVFGLIHLVTGDTENEHVLSHLPDFDPTKPVDMTVYAPGEKDIDWNKEVARLNEQYPLVVFSKTFCPYSKRAKALLETYNLSPPPKVIEVDLRDDAPQMKLLLGRLTQHSTFPNILVLGKSIGGSDNLQGLHADKALKRVLEKAGLTVGAEDV